MDWNMRPQRAPDLEISEVTDGFVVSHPDDPRIHYLNATAAFILEACDGSLPASELPELVALAFQLDRGPADDVAACLAALLREGLLVQAGPAASPAP